MPRLTPWLLTAALVAACGPKVRPVSFIEEEDPRAGERSRAPSEDEPADPSADEPGDASPPSHPSPLGAPSDLAPAPPPSGALTGTIDRAALLRVLDAGPGALLRTLEVAPAFEGERFFGWRIEQIVDPSSPVHGARLAPGDVVRSINERSLARPEHVLAVWQALRTANELRCEVWRDRARLALRFTITPPAGAATPAKTTPPASAAR